MVTCRQDEDQGEKRTLQKEGLGRKKLANQRKKSGINLTGPEKKAERKVEKRGGKRNPMVSKERKKR